jgi:hypothetical protein
MSQQLKPINDPKDLPDHINTAEVLIRLQKVEEDLARITSMVKACGMRLDKLENGSAPQEKELLKVGRYEPYILEVLGDNRIHSIHDMAEQIRQNYPKLPGFSIYSLGASAGKMAKANKIVKIAHGNYRKLSEE